jgi:hypothetical protein
MELISLFPTWYEPAVGSGWVVGFIATFHILASHTSVGAALLFAYLSYRAWKDDRKRPTVPILYSTVLIA